MLTERLQLLLSPDQRRRLESEARRRGTSVASLIRQAIDAQFGPVKPEDRLRALDEIRTMDGRFLPPEELDRVIEGERESDLPATDSG